MLKQGDHALNINVIASLHLTLRYELKSYIAQEFYISTRMST